MASCTWSANERQSVVGEFRLRWFRSRPLTFDFPSFDGFRSDSLRKEQFYIKKYGPEAGAKIYELLQKLAAHARWRADFKKTRAL